MTLTVEVRKVIPSILKNYKSGLSFSELNDKLALELGCKMYDSEGALRLGY